MTKKLKIILIISIGAILCVGSFFAGVIYYSVHGVKNIPSIEVFESRLLSELSAELIALSEGLNEKKHDDDSFDKVLSSFETTIKLLDNASYYTNNDDTIKTATDFATSMRIIYDTLEGGLSYKGELVCYDFMVDGSIRESEQSFLLEFKQDLDEAIDTLDSTFISLSPIAEKYSEGNIPEVFMNRGLDKGEHIQSIIQRSKEAFDSETRSPEANEILNPPELKILSYSDSFKAYGGASTWQRGYPNYLSLNTSSSSPQEILANHEVEFFLYEGEEFRLFFNVQPQGYTISILSDSGAKISTDYKLNEFIKMADKNMKFVVDAKWAQGRAFYTFEIGLKKPHKWG